MTPPPKGEARLGSPFGRAVAARRLRGPPASGSNAVAPRPKIGKVTSGPKTQQICGGCHLSGGTSGNSSGTREPLARGSLVRGDKWRKPHKTWLFLPLVTFKISSHRGDNWSPHRRKKSVQLWPKPAGTPGFSTLVHVWISSRGSAPGCERMCYPWTIC